MEVLACISGWRYLAHTNKCYKYINSMFNFQGARDYCKRQAPSPYTGDSVSIKDRQTQDLVNEIARQKIWTSGCKINGAWVWGDRSPFSYSHWKRGEPNNSGGNELFVEATPRWSPGDWRWNDLSSRHRRCTICEY